MAEVKKQKKKRGDNGNLVRVTPSNSGDCSAQKSASGDKGKSSSDKSSGKSSRKSSRKKLDNMDSHSGDSIDSGKSSSHNNNTKVTKKSSGKSSDKSDDIGNGEVKKTKSKSLTKKVNDLNTSTSAPVKESAASLAAAVVSSALSSQSRSLGGKDGEKKKKMSTIKSVSSRELMGRADTTADKQKADSTLQRKTESKNRSIKSGKSSKKITESSQEIVSREERGAKETIENDDMGSSATATSESDLDDDDDDDDYQSSSRDASIGAVSNEDYSDDADEGRDGYKVGGYHEVRIGEVYNRERFVVEEKLGWGHFSTVWLVFDRDNLKYCAMKVQKSARSYTEAAKDEIKLLRTVMEKAQDPNTGKPRKEVFVVSLIEHFTHRGPHGKHVCMVFECLGDNLLTLIKHYRYNGLPMRLVRQISFQMLMALAYLHDECEIIHTDLKPENVLIAGLRGEHLISDLLPSLPSLKAYARACESCLVDAHGSSPKRRSATGGSNGNFATVPPVAPKDPGEYIRQLESMLNANPVDQRTGKITGGTFSADERKKLKKKLKKLRQKFRNRASSGVSVTNETDFTVDIETSAGVLSAVGKAVTSKGEASHFTFEEQDVNIRSDKDNGNNCKVSSASINSVVASLQSLSLQKEEPEHDDLDPALLWLRQYFMGNIELGVESMSTKHNGANRSKISMRKSSYALSSHSRTTAPFDLDEKRSCRVSMLVPLCVMKASFGPPSNVPHELPSSSEDGESLEDYAQWALSLHKDVGVGQGPVEHGSVLVRGRGVSDSKIPTVALGALHHGFGVLSASVTSSSSSSSSLRMPDFFAVDREHTRLCEWSIRCDERVLPFVLAAIEDIVQLQVSFLACPPLPVEYINEEMTASIVARQFIAGGPHALVANTSLMRCVIKSFKASTHLAKGSPFQGLVKGLRISCPLSLRPLQDRFEAFALQAPFPAGNSEQAARFHALFTQDVSIEGGFSSPSMHLGGGGILRALTTSKNDTFSKSCTLSPIASPSLTDKGGTRHGSTEWSSGDSKGLRVGADAPVAPPTGAAAGRKTGPRSAKSAQPFPCISHMGLQSLGADHKTWSEVTCKVVDLGNACYRKEHFSEDIQTRQYRCPEVIIQSGYDTPSDMWSMACVIFELATGDLLFDPKESTNADYDRDEDHLALMMELMGKIPKSFALSGSSSRNYFNRKAELKHIHTLKMWPLKDVLVEKYKFTEKAGKEFAHFLSSMLAFRPEERATARECLAHPWLADAVYCEAGEQSEREVGKPSNKDEDDISEEDEDDEKQ